MALNLMKIHIVYLTLTIAQSENVHTKTNREPESPRFCIVEICMLINMRSTARIKAERCVSKIRLPFTVVVLILQLLSLIGLV